MPQEQAHDAMLFDFLAAFRGAGNNMPGSDATHTPCAVAWLLQFAAFASEHVSRQVTVAMSHRTTRAKARALAYRCLVTMLGHTSDPFMRACIVQSLPVPATTRRADTQHAHHMAALEGCGHAAMAEVHAAFVSLFNELVVKAAAPRGEVRDDRVRARVDANFAHALAVQVRTIAQCVVCYASLLSLTSLAWCLLSLCLHRWCCSYEPRSTSPSSPTRLSITTCWPPEISHHRHLDSAT